MEYSFYVRLCALNKLFGCRCAFGRALMERFPDLESFFALDYETLKEMLGGNGELASRIRDPELFDWARREVDWAMEYGIKLLKVGSEGYPRRLAECPDAPLMLYCKGEADLNSERALAVVGTRRATYYGKEWCRKIIEKMSSLQVKPLIISGLALGIDGVSHNASIDCGLKTVAVLPTGLDEIYPAAHRELAKRIIGEGGALVTDFQKGTVPVKYTFVRRNRIIAGMSDALLLAESFAPGGGLITASLAAQYDRTVFAVPGRMTDASFTGCNQLISTNVAAMVTDVDTIAREMRWDVVKKSDVEPELCFENVSEAGRTVLALLKERSPLSLEEIVKGTGLEPRILASELVGLEMDGKIRSERQFYYLCG